jgi:hypothetical protein
VARTRTGTHGERFDCVIGALSGARKAELGAHGVESTPAEPHA